MKLHKRFDTGFVFHSFIQVFWSDPELLFEKNMIILKKQLVKKDYIKI